MKKTDDFTELDFHDIRPGHGLSRRDFLKLAGGGVVILFTVGDPLLEAQRRGQPLPEDFNAFLRIGADGRVSCFTGKIEMGQGVITSLAMMLADELEVPLDDVDMVMGDTDLCPWDMGTFGSMTTRFFGPPLRTAAAEARAVLVELASEHFGVPAAGLEVKDGAVRIKAEPGKSVTYAELTKGRAIASKANPSRRRRPSSRSLENRS
jgi:nicotinate dehydrogenase subunit B